MIHRDAAGRRQDDRNAKERLWTGRSYIRGISPNRPFQERVDLIKDADFFIGLSSGLSWIAWGCKLTVTMISGFTNPTNEFYTPYRVINFHTCNSCWNDMRENFDHFDFLWCPRHKGTERQFECTRLITSEQVINTIKRIPAFQKRCPG